MGDFHFEVYRDEGGEFRWRLQTANGGVVAEGGEGYDMRAGAHAAVNRLKEWGQSGSLAGAPVMDTRAEDEPESPPARET